MILIALLAVPVLMTALSFAWGFGAFLLADPLVEEPAVAPQASLATSAPDESVPLEARQQAAIAVPTATELWAYYQAEKLLSGKPADIRSLAQQAAALAVVDGEDSETALQMDLRDDQFDPIWNRVRAKYDTEWVRGYMVSGTRSAYVYTLLRLYIKDKAPNLFTQTPGPYEADQWSAWLDEHAEALGW